MQDQPRKSGQERGFFWWAHNYRQQIWSEQTFS